MAGEMGPEPVFGGKAGATVQTAGAGKGVNQVLNIGKMDQNILKQTRRQFGRIAMEAAG